jgi:hypothetical protein
VRVAHRHARPARIDARGSVIQVHRQRHVDDLRPRQRRRDALGLQDRLAHIDADRLDLAAGEVEVQRQHAAAGLDLQRVVARQAAVVDELGDAADAVAAHLRLAAVGVEHAHLRVGDLGAADEDEAVAADAEVAVAHGARQGRRVGGFGLVEAIDVDVVVAEAVHLHESHGQNPGLGGCAHSHSIVAGGLLLMSYTTRFTPATSLMIRVDIFASNS